MDLNLLFWIIVMVLIILLIISIIKKLIKIALVVGVIFLILFLLTGGSITKDFATIKEKMNSSQTIVLLEHNGNILTGFVDSEELNLFDDKYSGLISGLYAEGKLKEIAGDNYKLFIIKSTLLSNLSGIKINNKEISTGSIISYFASGEPINAIVYEDLSLTLKIKNNQDRIFKAALFAYLYENKIKLSKAPIFFFTNYRSGNIIVYPESAFFKFSKIIPLAWIEQNLNKLGEKIKEGTGELANTTKEKIKEAI